MKQVDKFWYVVVYDESGVPVALYQRICHDDGPRRILPIRGLARIIRLMPLLFSRLRHLKLLICGLPIGTGLHTLGLAQRSASPQILAVLDGIILRSGDRGQSRCNRLQGVRNGDLHWTEPLLELGYRRIPTPPMHFFKPVFDDFAQYCAALRRRYRRQINRSRRKLMHPGLELTVLTDPDEILRAYTSEVHALYHQMADRAAIKMEVLPIEFLHQMTLRLNGHVELVAIRKDGQMVAFGWCLHDQSSYYTMYAGLDYQLNRAIRSLFQSACTPRSIVLAETGFDHRCSAWAPMPSRPGSAAIPSHCTCL